MILPDVINKGLILTVEIPLNDIQDVDQKIGKVIVVRIGDFRYAGTLKATSGKEMKGSTGELEIYKTLKIELLTIQALSGDDGTTDDEFGEVIAESAIPEKGEVFTDQVIIF